MDQWNELKFGFSKFNKHADEGKIIGGWDYVIGLSLTLGKEYKA